MPDYQVRRSQWRQYVLHKGAIVAALSYNRIRGYVFPLLTPQGVSVLAECPPDHVHHQGIVVGQDLVNGENFWTLMHPGYPRHVQHGSLDNVRSQIDDDGVTLSSEFTWKTETGRVVMDDERIVRVEAWQGFHFVGVTSTWTASYGDIFFGQTKEGGLGMRVAQQLETEWGGTIRSSKGPTGGSQIFDTTADWVEVSGRVGQSDVGVVMMPHPSMEQIPWFTRDYGLHMYGPMRHQTRKLSAGHSMTLNVGFAAYDGKLGDSQADAAWNEYQHRHGSANR